MVVVVRLGGDAGRAEGRGGRGCAWFICAESGSSVILGTLHSTKKKKAVDGKHNLIMCAYARRDNQFLFFASAPFWW